MLRRKIKKMKLIHINTAFITLNIRNRRMLNNYCQEYVAGQLNISQNAYSKLELGYSQLTVNRLFQIAKILEISVTDLLKVD
jgi:transcriptional regulator with XRE-family HTH domain